MYKHKIEFIPPIVAHRGAPLAAPENTIESFIAARDAGVTWLETDVKITSDGVPVLMHDDTLERTTSGHGPISQMTWEELQALDAGSWFSPSFSKARVLSLAEMLNFCRGSQTRLILELKPSPGRTQATVMVALIEAAKLWPEGDPPPVISSFFTDALLIAAQLHPDWPRGLLLNEWRDNWIESAVLTQASTVTMKEDLLTPERLETLKGSPIPVLAYTVNDPARAKELLDAGIKAVYSDDAPALLKSKILSPS